MQMEVQLLLTLSFLFSSLLCMCSFFRSPLLGFCGDLVARASSSFGAFAALLSYGCPGAFHSLVVCEASSQVLPKWGLLLYGNGTRGVIVAAAVDNGANHLYFRAASTFVTYYRGILPPGNVFRWEFKKDVVAWLNSVVYHSFVRYSGQHVGQCWYVLDIPGPEFTGPTRIPLGLAHVFQGEGVGKWILLKHGSKTWSVFICDNELTRGWKEFCDAHDLQVNYKVVIGCERRWVFEVFVLDDTNVSVVYPWSKAYHGWQALLPLPGSIVSSCLPSALERQQLNLKFMLLVTPDADYLMELQNCVSQLFQDTGVQEINIKMGTRVGMVPFAGGSLDSVALGQFVAALELDVFDSMFVAVSPALELQVIVFDGDSVEKVYEWS